MIKALDAYALLRKIGARTAEFQSREAGIEVNGNPVQHAIDSNGLPLLLVPLGPEEAELTDVKSKGVSLTSHILRQHEDLVRTLVVRCLDSRLERQFFLMVDDMVGALKLNLSNPGLSCLEVVAKWRELFELQHVGLLSSSAQIGLLAELHVLEMLVKRDPVAGLQVWAGPNGGRHDFLTEKCSVEVKATTHRDNLTVKIHGAKQLDDYGRGNLWVYVEQMEFSPAGESLPNVIDRIAARVVDKALLFRQLGRLGYKLEDADDYDGSRLVVLRTRLCPVDQDFPRLVSSSLKHPALLDRIERLEYSIDMGTLISPVGDDAALSKVGKLLS